jgi:pyridoxal phosphate enzyme (YggS family)
MNKTDSIGIEQIGTNLAGVRTRIAAAAARVGRDGSGIQLVVVTKGHPAKIVRRAYAAGVRVFGENRVQEALAKQAQLADLQDASWHMIGHIQSRKAKNVIPNFAMVHSIDRPKIANMLDRFAAEHNVRLPVLLECNVSGEEAKFGWPLSERGSWQSRLAQLRAIAELPHLDVRGLMTMAPWLPEQDVVRAVFRRLRELSCFLEDNIPGYWQELSMGMTDDYEVAVEEGATIVRIGRAILGSLTTAGS